MVGTSLRPGDVVAGIVTAVKPFGLFVAADGVPGLVRGATAVVGASVRLRVVEFDGAAQRFSAVLG